MSSNARIALRSSAYREPVCGDLIPTKGPAGGLVLRGRASSAPGLSPRSDTSQNVLIPPTAVGADWSRNSAQTARQQASEPDGPRSDNRTTSPTGPRRPWVKVRQGPGGQDSIRSMIRERTRANRRHVSRFGSRVADRRTTPPHLALRQPFIIHPKFATQPEVNSCTFPASPFVPTAHLAEVLVGPAR